MTKKEAADWIRANLPTKTVDGVDHAYVSDAYTGGACSVCGVEHDDNFENHEISIPVDDLAEQYHEHMANAASAAIAGAAVSTVANHVVDNPIEYGNERYFQEVL